MYKPSALNVKFTFPIDGKLLLREVIEALNIKQKQQILRRNSRAGQFRSRKQNERITQSLTLQTVLHARPNFQDDRECNFSILENTMKAVRQDRRINSVSVLN